ncbi:MAG: CoA-binding protein [Desulfatiglandaceae bacterium]
MKTRVSSAKVNPKKMVIMAEKNCELPDCNPPEADIVRLLEQSHTIAVVGLSPKEQRDSNRVARYLIEQGYDVIPVNPGQENLLGRRCYRRVSEVPVKIDIVDCFISPSRIPQVVEEAVEVGAGTLWMQLGVVHNEAAARAREAGLQVVMNKCIMVEHKRLKAAS